jgi:hypothetical protein
MQMMQLTNLKLPNRNSQIGFIEPIRNVPPKWTELTPLLHEGVEEAQTIQQLFKDLKVQT